MSLLRRHVSSKRHSRYSARIRVDITKFANSSNNRLREGRSPYSESVLKEFDVAVKVTVHFRRPEGRFNPFGETRHFRRRVDSVGNTSLSAQDLLAGL